MNCRRVEKLIPLYVEGDLASSIADRLASHLDWCGRCNWLADEYKESQSWLRTNEPPEFDEAFLDTLKNGVLRRIEETAASPSLLASFVQQWTRRQILALSAALLLIFGVLVFYVYQRKMSVNQQVFVTSKQTPEEEKPTPNEPLKAKDTGTAPGVIFSKHHHHRSPANSSARDANPIITKQEGERPLVSQRSRVPESGAAVSGEPAGGLQGSHDDLPEMLRIEIQTGDPNIRIIWFAPKEVEIPKTVQ